MADQLITKTEKIKKEHTEPKKSAGTPYKTLDRHQTAVDHMRKVSTVAPIKESYIREATTTTKIR